MGRVDLGAADWRLSLLLFALTLVTTTLTGAAYVGAPLAQWYHGLSFSLPLVTILLTHEMGHYLAAKRRGVSTSPPYFLPLPPSIGIGTLGAVIRIREPITSRNALMEIGAAGPLMGLTVAIPVLVVGVLLSEVKEIPLVSQMQVMSEGNSLLYLFVKYVVHGSFLPFYGRDIMMHPVAFAGWIGLLITMINLIPVGQLDGGHIAFAWFGDRYTTFSKKLHRALPLLGAVVFCTLLAGDLVRNSTKNALLHLTGQGGSYGLSKALVSAFSSSLPWFVWPLILLVLQRLSGGMVHPPVGSDPLTRRSRVIALVTLLLFILIFMPVPMRIQ